jgi:AraC-like DNA-binding protein
MNESADQPDLGLRLGPRYHLSAYGMLGLAVMTSSNLVDAFEVLFRNILMTWTYMNWSPRTIQRKLTLEGTSFKELLEDVRKNLSLEYLQSTDLSVENIALRLGYADAPSFSHAFKRWTGQSPRSARRRT